MAVTSVSLNAPTTDPAITVGGSFTQTGQVSGSGPWNYTMYFQWDQGTASWATIGTSTSAGLYHAATNPLPNQTDNAAKNLTVFGGAAGSYNVRMRVVDHNGFPPDREWFSSSQAVTVSAGGGGSRNRIHVAIQ